MYFPGNICQALGEFVCLLLAGNKTCFLCMVEESDDVSLIVNRVLHSWSGGHKHPGGTRREAVGP